MSYEGRSGGHLRTTSAKIRDEDEDYVPVHWMGNHKVEMVMVRRDAEGSKKRKEAHRERLQERKAWKRLAKESERLINSTQPVYGQLDYSIPNPVCDSDTRLKVLSSMKPPPRLTSKGDFHSPKRDTSDKPDPSLEASDLVASLFEADADDTNSALCPFSGSVVSLQSLPDHMQEWRSMMKAELLSLSHDPQFGLKIGLFVIPEIPGQEPPTVDASPEEIQNWNELAAGILKTGYIMSKLNGKKYHWSELRNSMLAYEPRGLSWNRVASQSGASTAEIPSRAPIVESSIDKE